MKLIIALIVVICVSQQSILSQESTWMKFYKDLELTKETDEKKANFKIFSNVSGKDSIVEVVEIKSNKTISHMEYSNNRLYGKCFYWNKETLETDTVYYGNYRPNGFYTYDIKDQKIQAVEGEFTNPMFITEGEQYNKNKKYDASFATIWIAATLRYPIEAMQKGIQGRVYAQFTLDEKGTVGNISIIRGVDKLLDIEAYRVLKSIPQMYPALLNEKPIKIFVQTPINFVL
jgi:TonB family protein